MKAKVISTGAIIDVEKREERVGKIIYVYYYAQSGESFQDYELEFLPDTHEEVTIEGWVTRSKNGKIVFSDSPECKRGSCVWYHKEGSNIVTLSDTGLFNEDILPSVTWKSEPKRVRITLTPIEE